MGIHGLTGFIDSNQHLLQQHHLHDCSVVLDGNNFYHFLYYTCHVQCSFGGDYDVYRKKIISTFESFKTCGITAYVIMDGAYTVDGRKLRTSLSRASARIKLVDTMANNQKGQALPALAYETFMQTLNELRIHHATCQFEADNEIAVLANKLNCPVISNDSDFYIFDLNNGFLPLDYLDFRTLERVESDGSKLHYLHCHKYHVDDFINSFDGLSRSVLPVFASLLGNDFINASAFSTFYSRVKVPKVISKKFSLPPRLSKVISVLHWLNTQTDSSEFSDIQAELLEFIKPRSKVRVEKMFVSSVNGYVDVENFQGIDLFHFLTGDAEQCPCTAAEEFRSYNGTVFPDWFVKAACCGEVTPSTLNCAILHRVIILTQVEDLSQESSFQCSLALRQVLYGVLLQEDLKQQPAGSAIISYSSPGIDCSSEELPSQVYCTSQAQKNTHKLSDCFRLDEGSHDVSSSEKGASVILYGRVCDVRTEERQVGVDLKEGCGDVVKEVIAECDSAHDANTGGDCVAVNEVEPGAEVCDSQMVLETKTEDAERKTKEFCVEEYTRLKKNLLKNLVEPVYCVGTVPVPGLAYIPNMAVAERKSVLAAALGVDLDFMARFCEELQLFAGCLVMWARNVRPRISPGHLETVVAGVILLQVCVSLAERTHETQEVENTKTGDEMENGDGTRNSKLTEQRDGKVATRISEQKDKKKSLKIQQQASELSRINCELEMMEQTDKINAQSEGSISGKKTCENNRHETQPTHVGLSSLHADCVSVARLCSQVRTVHLENIRQNLHKYHAKSPVFNNKNLYTAKVPHAFAQLQACMLDAINLNKLLQRPFPTIRPADFINGTFLYNFYTDLSVRANPDLFLTLMFDRSPDVISTFKLFRDLIISYVGGNCFDSPSSLSKKIRKRRPKGEKKLRTDQEMSKEKSSDKEKAVNLVAGFDVANKFSVLSMDDS
ncbi:unnamed protein product [Candidula unifasciata]|uniref:Asteroid domain-containing protein n=1 Tax=Candidula unifasciata TaxID=100452 RepID=A0A8S3Z840_9EUPU|nr:unnamed protein product [Candidula unifasciata]